MSGIAPQGPMFPYTYRMPSWHARQLRRWGDGNASKGVRKVIELTVKLESQCKKKGPHCAGLCCIECVATKYLETPQ